MESSDGISVKSSSLEPEIYAFRIKKYYNAIVKDIEPKKILGFLYQEEIFDEDDMDEVRSERTRKKQAELMLSMLGKTGPKGYQVLVEALKEKQPHLAKMMKTPVPDEKLDKSSTTASLSGSNQSVAHQSVQSQSLCFQELERMVRSNLSLNEPVEQGESCPSSSAPNTNAQTESGMPFATVGSAATDFIVNTTNYDFISPLYRPNLLDSVYEMRSSPRGIAVILNIEKFKPNSKTNNQRKEELEIRNGSKVDADDLEKLFKALDFKVVKLIDKTEKEIREELKKISESNMSAYSCFVMCIMSHGKDDFFYASDGGQIKIVEIKKLFDNAHCPTLCQKPKLFFIQACRGKMSDFGRTVGDAPSEHSCGTEESEDKPSFTQQKSSISENADILLAYSTVEGYTSYRNTVTGSRFIRHLIQIFKAFSGVEDVESMMTRVISEVNKAGELGEKQVPKPETTLTKKVFFWPGERF